MKETVFYSKQLIEIFRKQYQLDEPIISHFDNIIKNESNAFKIILFLTQLETLVPYEDLEFRMKALHGGCLFAMEQLTENPTVNLYESFLIKYLLNQPEDE